MSGGSLPKLEVDGVRPGLIGTGVWAVFALAATLLGPVLSEHGVLWWRDVTYAGVVLGLLGTLHVTLRRNRMRRRG